MCIMKRSLCSNHMYHLKTEGKTATLNQTSCSICRWNDRPLTLKDMARQLEWIAESMRIAHEDPYYDPFGFTYVGDLEKTLNRFYNTMHIDYRDNFIKGIMKDKL